MNEIGPIITVIVVVVIGLLMTIVIPRFRVSQTTKARQAADQLVRDLEAARSRALATRSLTRVAISAMSSSASRIRLST